VTLAVEERPRTLAEIRATLDVPDGVRVEILEEQIVMSPSPRAGHAMTLTLVQEQLGPACPADLMVVQNLEIVCPAAGAVLIPDLVVVARAVLLKDRPQNGADVVDLACEVTSPSTRRQDLTAKRAAYAIENVPLYLVVDRRSATLELFSDPADGTYRGRHTVPFGRLLPVPEPFVFTLDSRDFPASH